MKNLYESILSYTCAGKVFIKQLSRKVMDKFSFLTKQIWKEQEAFRKKYFPHVENLVLIDIK